MDDAQIVQMYWDRSERAITETDAKYGDYCYSIAYNAYAPFDGQCCDGNAVTESNDPPAAAHRNG